MGHVRGARRRGCAALIATAEDWLREQGMTRALGPIQPVDLGRAGPADRGLRRAADGDDGPSSARISRWIEAAGYAKAKDLLTYELDIRNWT